MCSRNPLQFSDSSYQVCLYKKYSNLKWQKNYQMSCRIASQEPPWRTVNFLFLFHIGQLSDPTWTNIINSDIVMVYLPHSSNKTKANFEIV